MSFFSFHKKPRLILSIALITHLGALGRNEVVRVFVYSL
jgi:hypothetical protein